MESSARRNAVTIFAVAVMLVIAAIFVQQWPERGFWYDETVNATFAQRSLGDIWEWCTRVDNQMPLDFVLRNLWGRVAGTGEFALRVYSVGWAVLAAAGVIALGRRLGGGLFAAGVAGLAFAVTQSALYAAFEVRPYALALALFAWSSVILWELRARFLPGDRGREPHVAWLLAAYGLLALALVYTHYTGLVALAAHGVFVGLALLRRPFRRGWLWVGVVFAGIAAGYLPWIAALAGRDVRAGTAYAGQIAPWTALREYLDFYTYGQREVPPDAPPYALAMGLIVLVAAGALMVRARRSTDQGSGASFALLLLAIPIAGLLIMVFGVQGKLSGRHGWPAWIGAALVIGLGVSALRRLRGLRWLAAAGAILVLTLPARPGYAPTYNSYLREAFAYIAAHAEPHDVLVLRDGTLFAAAEYYDARVPWIGLPPEQLTDVNRFLFFNEAVQELAALVQEHAARRVWVLTWQGQIMDPQDLVDGILEASGQAQPLTGAFGFGDVSLALYALKDNPATLRERVAALGLLAETPGGGPTLLGGYVLNHDPVPHGGTVVIHLWWRRGTVEMPAMRVSVRLYDANGDFFAQVDQPPAGPSFGQEHWPPDMPIFSRYVFWVPPEMPVGPAEVRAVIYDVSSTFEPVSASIAVFAVQD